MSDSTESLVKSIMDQDFVAANETLDIIMKRKAVDEITNQRAEVAQGMFDDSGDSFVVEPAESIHR